MSRRNAIIFFFLFKRKSHFSIFVFFINLLKYFVSPLATFFYHSFTHIYSLSKLITLIWQWAIIKRSLLSTTYCAAVLHVFEWFLHTANCNFENQLSVNLWLSNDVNFKSIHHIDAWILLGVNTLLQIGCIQKPHILDSSHTR